MSPQEKWRYSLAKENDPDMEGYSETYALIYKADKLTEPPSFKFAKGTSIESFRPVGIAVCQVKKSIHPSTYHGLPCASRCSPSKPPKKW
jgi:hypothetical protein